MIKSRVNFVLRSDRIFFLLNERRIVEGIGVPKEKYCTSDSDKTNFFTLCICVVLTKAVRDKLQKCKRVEGFMIYT